MGLHEAVQDLERAGALEDDEAKRIRARLPASAGRSSAAVILGPLAVVLVAVVVLPLVDDASDPVPAAGLGAAVLVIGGTLIGAAVAWCTEPVLREGLLLAGATTWALADLLIHESLLWAALPGFLLAWGSLGLVVGPWARAGFAALTWPASAAVLTGLGVAAATAGVATTALLGIHLALVWAAEPIGSPLRRYVPIPLMAGSALVLVTVTEFLLSGISLGRVVAFIIAAGALSLSSGLVLDQRLRQFTLAPVWRRVPLAD